MLCFSILISKVLGNYAVKQSVIPLEHFTNMLIQLCLLILQRRCKAHSHQIQMNHFKGAR